MLLVHYELFHQVDSNSICFVVRGTVIHFVHDIYRSLQLLKCLLESRLVHLLLRNLSCFAK